MAEGLTLDLAQPALFSKASACIEKLSLGLCCQQLQLWSRRDPEAHGDLVKAAGIGSESGRRLFSIRGLWSGCHLVSRFVYCSKASTMPQTTSGEEGKPENPMEDRLQGGAPRPEPEGEGVLDGEDHQRNYQSGLRPEGNKTSNSWL